MIYNSYRIIRILQILDGYQILMIKYVLVFGYSNEVDRFDLYSYSPNPKAYLSVHNVG